jgi:hypothetical protein
VRSIFIVAAVLTFGISSAADARIAQFRIRALDPITNLESINGLNIEAYWLTVSWRADRTLGRGYHYEGELASAKPAEACVARAQSTSYTRPLKGKQMNLSFRDFHTEDEVSAVKWCVGKATVTIRVAKNGAKAGTGKQIGMTQLSFVPGEDEAR